MFENNQHKGNKQVLIIFTILSCFVGGVIAILGLKLFVIIICILISTAGSIALYRLKFYGTTFMGANLRKPYRDESLDLLSLNIETKDRKRT